MSSVNLASLFNPKSTVVDAARQSSAPADEYRVSFNAGKGGVYESVIRFIPWYANPEKSVMAKQVTWLQNPVTQHGMYIDDPKTVGQFSPVTDMFFKFYNSGNAVLQNFGKKYLSSKLQYASLVQIIKDEQHPELVGKIKVFKFGKKLYDKLVAEEHPAMGQGFNPFHPIYGRQFYIKCTSVAGFNNFDQSAFFDVKNAQNQILPSGFYYLNPATGNMEVVTENSNQQAVADYLAANSPDLSAYDYKPWTSEEEKFVNDVLKICADYMQTGQLSSNLSAVNTSESAQGSIGKMEVNNNPVFPGATMPQSAPAPSAGMGSFSMGQANLGGAPTHTSVGQPNITGIDIPNVEPSTVPSTGGVTTLGGSIGNIDDVIANL